MSRTKTIIQATPPSLIQQSRVDFDKSDFDALFPQKGYSAIWEKSFKCGCNTEGNDHPNSTCKNCGGVGWIWVNPTQTRIITHSNNINTQFKEWSELKLGTVSMTFRDPFKLSYFDKVTLLESEAVYTERLYPFELDGETYAFSLYPIISIEAVLLFVDDSTKLTLLIQDTDFTISDNIITFSDNSYDEKTVTIRYIHRPEYRIVDIPRESMVTPVKNSVTGKSNDVLMPIHAIAQRTHLVQDSENKAGNRLLDNSY
jgi:hypothetical protein